MSDRIPNTDRPGRPAAETPARDARDDMRAGLEEARTSAANVAETVRSEAGEAAQDVARRAESLADQQRTAGAGHAEDVRRALDRAAEELDEGSPRIACLVRDAAGSVQDIADALRSRTPGQLLHDVNDLARRQPMAFFGVSVLAGFAVARFARSGRPQGDTDRGRGDAGGTAHDARGPRSGAAAPGWIAPDDATGANRRPATMAAATLGGAAAHRPDHAPSSAPRGTGG